MSDSNDPIIISNDETYVWNANDWANLITISASAIASVLLVVFKSRCTTINLCFGLLSCNRKPKEDSEEEQEEEEPVIPPKTRQIDSAAADTTRATDNLV